MAEQNQEKNILWHMKIMWNSSLSVYKPSCIGTQLTYTSLTLQQSWLFFEGTQEKKQIRRRERKHINRTCIRPRIVSSRRTFRNILTSSSQQRPKQLNVLNQSSGQRICPQRQASSGQPWIQPLQTQSSYLGSQIYSGWLVNPSFYRWRKTHMVKTCPRP